MALYLRDAFEIKTAYDLNDDMRGGENYIYIYFFRESKRKRINMVNAYKTQMKPSSHSSRIALCS